MKIKVFEKNYTPKNISTLCVQIRKSKFTLVSISVRSKNKLKNNGQKLLTQRLLLQKQRLFKFFFERFCAINAYDLSAKTRFLTFQDWLLI